MNSDPFLVAVGIIGTRELTDELLNEVLGMLPKIEPGLDDESLLGIRKQLEASIGVSVSAGQGLHGGDIAPWLDDAKAGIKWTYWDAYKNQLKSKGFGLEVIRVLDEDTDNILTECGNPAMEGGWCVKGLVMGDVQSGKTASYCGLMSKAADAGYKFIVLLTGMIEDLRAQSQERLDEGFVGRDSRELLDGKRATKPMGAGRFRSRIPNVLTSIDADFLTANKRALGGIPLENINEPVLLVMKKNRSPLSNLIQFLDSQMKGGASQVHLPLLLVDDEADNASVNSRKDEDPAAINRLIRELLGRFSRSSYVAYTATPFANVFINPDISDLFPSNFVYSLNTPSNYIGVSEYFSESGSHRDFVEDITDAEALLPFKHKKDHVFSAIPISMKDAIGTFLLSCAIRDLRKEPLKHRSMLVNASRFTDVQARIASFIKSYLYALTEDIKQYLASDEHWNMHPSLAHLHELWVAQYTDCGVKWDRVRKALYEAVSSIKVVTINQRSDASERLNYGQYIGSRLGRRVIAVGGLTLSRGLTLEGLCVSYFYRNSKAYDTLLQMGRWFGYRTGYDDLCRIWVDPDAQGWFSHISDVVGELRYDIRRMHANRQPPSEFGMRIRSHAGTLMVTALNKMRNANKVEVAVSYSGFGAETPLLPDDRKRNLHNLSLVSKFVNELGPAAMLGNRCFWRNVDKLTVSDLLDELEILDVNAHFMRDMNGQNRPLLSFVRNNDIDALKSWDICLPQGEGERLEDICVADGSGDIRKISPRIRQFERVLRSAGYLRLNKQRVGEISDERVDLSELDKQAAKNRWEEMRKKDKKLGETIPGYIYREFRQRPLLTLHVIEPGNAKEDSKRFDKMMKVEDIKPSHLVAVSLSFPRFDGAAVTVPYAMNKVALRSMGLLDDAEDSDEDED